ncbi:MAG: Queuine tRNA-ribosyltransferase [Candidatus Gottesmanbacteria bacterium GW2011_GWA2_42_16]|nr:MAG: Queuine tRNA-ribosyltransferase [Candidatus Gottesmanbacteria bacterium GW2011_GWA2_42_16]
MMKTFNFQIKKELANGLGRAGVIHTPHGDIETPAFIVVGTKATVKALTPEQVSRLGVQAVLANTYHLYLEPGDELVAKAGGLQNFMNWHGPTFTDSGGFQVFSLGAAFGEGGLTKFAVGNTETQNDGRVDDSNHAKLAQIDDDGVTFRSHLDGSEHRLTPEKSIQIQHNLGADIIFAFDECTAPSADYDYQKKALARTHAWAERSLAEHQKLDGPQSLFGIVQGGRHQDLRQESAGFIGSLAFDGFGIGGSFDKDDMGTAVRWVCENLPKDKPRHLLGIGAVEDIFTGIENGADTFDCVAPTREARNGSLYTATGRININNAQYRQDFGPIEDGCGCYVCSPRLDGGVKFSRSYLAHLFRSKEMLAATLASIHNLYFFVNLVKKIRQSILDENFAEFKQEFLTRYKN